MPHQEGHGVPSKGDPIFFFVFFFISWAAAPVSYEGSQARGPIGAVATGLHHSRSNVGSKLHLQPIPQLTATLDP